MVAFCQFQGGRPHMVYGISGGLILYGSKAHISAFAMQIYHIFFIKQAFCQKCFSARSCNV